MPLNEGALKNINLIFSKDSMLILSSSSSGSWKCRDIANIIDILNGAISIQAACYGTMSNVFW